MREANACRLVGDLCFIYSLLCSFPVFSEMGPALAVLAALGFVAVYLATGINNVALRLVLGLVPAMSVVMIHTVPGYIVAGASVVFILVMVIRNELTEHWIYIKAFTFMGVMTGVILLVEIIRGGNDIWTVIFGVTFILLGILALKNLRWGIRKADFKIFLVEIGELLLPSAVVGAVAAGIYYILMNVTEIIVFIGTVFGYILTGLSNIFGSALDMLTVTSPKGQEEDFAAHLVEEASGFSETAERDWVLFKAPSDKTLWLILGGILAALLVWAIVSLLRHYLSYKPDNNRKMLVAEEQEALDVYRTGSRRRRFRRNRLGAPDYGKQIRQIYREYLQFLSANKIVLGAATTSADVFEVKRDEYAAELRQIYIRARYSGAQAVTKENVDRARELKVKLTEKNGEKF